MGGFKGNRAQQPAFVHLVDENGNPVDLSSAAIVLAGLVDKATFTEGATRFGPVGGVRNDSLVGDVAEDQAAAVRITPKRGQHVNLRDNSGIEIDLRTLLEAIRDNTSDLEVNTDTLEAKLQSLIDRFPAASSLGDNEANPSVSRIGVYPLWYDGSTHDRARGDAEFGLDVDVTRSALPAGASTEASLALLRSETNTNLNDIEADVEGLRTAFDAEDFATQTTLAALKARADLLATEATLADLLARFPSALALADNTANPTLSRVATFPHVWDGSTWDRTPGDSVNGAFVNVKTSVLPTGAATEATLSALKTAFDAEDFASQATLASILTSVDGVEAKLDAANASLDSIEAEDFATEVSLAALLARFPAVAALADNTPNPSVTKVGVFPHVWDGSTWDRAPGDSANGAFVNVKTAVLPTGAATEQSLAYRNNLFASLINAMPRSTGDEIRMDDGTPDLYLGRNTDNVSTATASWEVVRVYRNAVTGKTERIRYRTGVAWDSRTAGW